MNDAQAARLVAELCLAEDLPLAEELRAFSPVAAGAAAGGDLPQALRVLQLDPRLADLGAVRPTALRRASGYLTQLPAPATVRTGLVQAALWFFFVALIQLLVLSILTLKVHPVLAKMLADHHLTWAPWSQLAGAALGLGGLALAAVAVVGARAPRWLPGWGRSLEQAREAALTAALVETRPPEGVLSDWLRQSRWLQQVATAPTAVDLLGLAHSRAAQAEQQMHRVVIVYRYAGFTLLAAVALAITVDVYASIAALAGVR